MGPPLTVYRFFLDSLFSPTTRDPFLMLEEDDVKGSGAATLESF